MARSTNFVCSRRALTPLEVRYLQTEAAQSAAGADDVVRVAGGERSARRSTAGAKLIEAREAENQIISRVPEVLVMGDTPTPAADLRAPPRPVHRSGRAGAAARTVADLSMESIAA